MSTTPVSPLTEIRAAHMLCTHSAPRPGGINLNKAGCSCGARYEWYGREDAHGEHVDAVIVARMADVWDEAYQHGYEDDGEPNPYRATQPTEHEEHQP